MLQKRGLESSALSLRKPFASLSSSRWIGFIVVFESEVT